MHFSTLPLTSRTAIYSGVWSSVTGGLGCPPKNALAAKSAAEIVPVNFPWHRKYNIAFAEVKGASVEAEENARVDDDRQQSMFLLSLVDLPA